MRNQYAFRQLLKNRRFPKKRIIVPRSRYPYQYEQWLWSMLKKMFKPSLDMMFTYLKSHQAQWQNRWESVHKDGWDADLERFLSSMETEIGDRIFDQNTIGFSVKQYVEKLVELIFAFDQGDLARQLEKIVGEKIYGGIEWWKTIKAKWIVELETRARGAATDFIFRSRNTVFRMVREGKDFNAILAELESRASGLTNGYLRFLARDLTGSLNGIIQHNLQTSIGINYYLWQTQADERVRGRPGGLYPDAPIDHWMMEGVLCRWDDPTVFSEDHGITWIPRTSRMPQLPPGGDFGCRCAAIPYLNLLAEEVDNNAA